MCRRCHVTGRVQGVFFRASTAERARALGIAGWAKNLPDGRVEVLACGTEEAVESLTDWLRRGPSGARVERVESEPAGETDVPNDFGIR
ncbi:MAG: acylphosphatase [Gammaproteobacteria bacterium]